MGGITHHANGRQQPFSDSTTRGFRGKTVALVDTGVVDTRPVPFGRQHAVTAGGISRGRGRSTPSGTVGSGGGCTTRGRGVLCLVLGLVRMCVVMRWRVWWLVSRPRRWGGFWGTGVGR